ncbi:3-oxoacyl-(acyl-carrier-protein) reductase [Mycolicibacterium rhodesiae JS60]|nr:3-oxoacyl-(acyl-carrier-protein) reductase [Mycolicibacterium rhodesiae JS60]
MTGRIVLVTGAASGIGAEVCRSLATSGDTVVAADLNTERAQSVVAALPAPTGAPHRVIEMDVSSETSVVESHTQIEQDIGPVAVLVTAAGVFPPAGDQPAVSGTTLADWQRAEGANGSGTFLCVREMLRARHATPVLDGRIVTFTSIGAQVGVVRANVAYAASKAAVMGITRCAAKEGAPLGITANCIAPGFIETPMLASAFTPADLDALVQSVPLKRLGHATEVAALVHFLAGAQAGYITGTTIDINGGVRIGP